jgi:glycosyltransferase involved in cell wall biosynthesis
MTPWLIVTGDFSTHGGMDSANYGLASYLARQPGAEVHLVAHAVAPELAQLPAVHVHLAARPLGSHQLGEPVLRRTARRLASRLSSRGARVVVNGGNADTNDASWVHYVHAAFEPHAAGAINARRIASSHRRHSRDERRVLSSVRTVICNSRRTASDVTGLLGVEPDRARVVYYGIDTARFGPVTEDERHRARRALEIAGERKAVLFAGALGDRRKNLDTLFAAWVDLCSRADWDADLLVAGCGAELDAWRTRAAKALPAGRIRFLGFRRDMDAVMAACDLVVHPARYEAYGQAVHEALCRGVPAIVSAASGIAERYPEDLRRLLIQDPESPVEIARCLTDWRGDTTVGARVAAIGACLRARTWDDMGRDIVVALDAGGRA